MEPVDEDRASFGGLLRRHRVGAGLTQEELAERSGLSVRMIGDLERGRTRRPYRSSVDLLVTALRLSEDDGRRFRATARGHRLDESADGAADGAADESADAGPAPAMLPADLADFVGRGTPIRQLTDPLVASGAGGPAPVPVVAVAGRGGAGKTALAVHVAHRVADRFPDGQLYADLHGATEPADPALVLGRFLRALGVDGAAIPTGLDERAELYRTLLAGHRVLVVLDNAATAAQVTPLIPGTAGCAVLVTSRPRLAELPSTERLDLGALEPEQAVDLLARIAGSDRVGAEPDTARQIVRLCGLLPLGVRIAGARLAGRPHWRLATLADRLADERRRLDELVAGELDVRASFALSYHGLAPDAARALRLLALLDAPEAAGWVAAALLDTDPQRAEDLLDTLAGAYLLDASRAAGPPRYRMHDLVRLYARELADRYDPEPDRRSALGRAFGAWLALADGADSRLPLRQSSPVHGAATRWPVPDPVRERLLSDPVAWFEAEATNLVTVVDQACRTGQPGLAWDLARCCAGYFDLRDLYDDWERTHRQCLAACESAADQLGAAAIMLGLGKLADIIARIDRDQAVALTERAGDTFRRLGRTTEEAEALATLGGLHRLAGRHRQALSCLHRGLALVGDDVHPIAHLDLLLQLGFVEAEQGRYEAVVAAAGQALDLARRCGWRHEEVTALHLLGSAHQRAGDPATAVPYLERALTSAAQVGNANSTAWVRCVIARAYTSLGRYDEARTALEDARLGFQRLRDPDGAAAVSRQLGDLAVAEGDPDTAIAILTDTLRRSRRQRLPYLAARTLASLGTAYRSAGDPAEAAAHWRQARDLFTELGNRTEAAALDALLADAAAAPEER